MLIYFDLFIPGESVAGALDGRTYAIEEKRRKKKV